MYGLGVIKAMLVAIALALFVVPWLHFAKETWDADATVKLNEGLVYVANLSAGVLASAFAVALGVKVLGGNGGDRSFGASLSWPAAPDWVKVAVTIGVWSYFIVGAIVLAVYLRDLGRTTSFAPPEVKDFALVFAGYAAAYLAVIVGARRSGPS